MNFKYVVDTHAIIWYLSGSQKIKSQALSAIKDVEKGNAEGFIATISLAELAYLFEKGRTTVSLNDVLSKIDSLPTFHIVPLERRIIEELPNIPQIPDLHDRILVALARLLDAKLVTKDEIIKNSGLIDIVWD
ncbi:type II toxin-antitoxin system VapC family toxin [Candidatus Poribacteria bacterium]|nr:type II toxin-antitoxin system VapC family toxin [Candidatus Poribacteria bacterium]